MGYRSEVAISMYKEDYNKLIEKISKNEDNFGELIELMNFADKIICINEDVVVIKWDWIKWYPEYTDIQKLTNFLLAEDEEGNILVPHCFVRVGEERGDIETYQHLDADWDLDCISPVSYIDVPEGEDIKVDFELNA